MTFSVKTAYAGDHARYNDVETLTYTPKSGGSPTDEAKGLREVIPQSPIGPGDIGTEHSDTVFHIWDSTLALVFVTERDADKVTTRSGAYLKLRGASSSRTGTPANGDVVTDSDSVSWTVLQATQNGREPLWRLACRKQVS